MKYLSLLILASILNSSCGIFDNKTQVAEIAVREKFENLPVKLLANMVKFQKTNGESFESNILFEPGVHKIYKLYYTAEFSAEVDGFIIEDKNGSAFERIFNESEIDDNFKTGQRFGYIQKRAIRKNENFEIKGYVLLRKKENGWEQVNE